MKLNQDEIKTILPHREPMLLVTSVEDLSPGEDIRAVFFADRRAGPFAACAAGVFPSPRRNTPSAGSSRRLK